MKQRLDVLVAEKTLTKSREKAKALIMSGVVFVDNQRVDKPGTMVHISSIIDIRQYGEKYVSRGGNKLEKALDSFSIELYDKITADIGASTGGFTDCMLKRGAKKVYAVDVGYGQIDWGLRNDPRVVNLERTNARYITDNNITELLDFFSVDVSFISLKLIVNKIFLLSKTDAEAVCLIKPQFEAGREKVGKHGVVRDFAVHVEVISKLVNFFSNNSVNVMGLDYSPIKGPKGNIEFLIHLKKGNNSSVAYDIEKIVGLAHKNL